MATVALVIGWTLTVAIAVGGWLANQIQARHDTRRTTRINFLLDAYRRLDHASNRPLTDDTSRELETAVSDIFLLGTPRQAELSAQFAKTFAADRAAEALPLLVDLRDSLRREAGLEKLPATYTNLRITPDSDSVSDRARIWHETSQATRRSVNAELAHQPIPPPTQPAMPPQAASPITAIATSYRQVERAARDILTVASTEDTGGLNLAQLANRALQLKLIDTRLADTLNGISVMRILATLDQDRITQAHADEFTALATAALYLLDIAARPPQQPKR